jgi:hypothetical protein
VTQYNDIKFIVPPREEEFVYPYRRAWRSVILELIALVSITGVIFVVMGMLGIRPPASTWGITNIIITLTPAILWGILSLWREWHVPQPRENLLNIAIISALVTSAIGIPVIEWLNPDEWLALAGRFDRILGYSFTIGLVQVSIIYGIVRIMTWYNAYRIRTDAIAYCTTAAIGCITVWNIHFLATGNITPDVVALRMFSMTSSILLASIIIAYGLAELRFNPKFYWILPLTILASMVIIGFVIAFRSNLISGRFILGIGGTRPIIGFGFTVGLLFAGVIGMLFLFNISERRAKEAQEKRN